ncbi:unnamed protein product [Rhizoctonia solani]|uniref:Uncharacterized protein n=1 Tax=Rhizoctonia solani TaxID=456999 RepID=A0A8H2WE84_9AGAM|nr:unnamed protein product [Rhizoctonia solani]
MLFGILAGCAYGAGVEHRYPLTTHSMLFGILGAGAYGTGVERRYPLTTHSMLFGILGGCAYGAGVEHRYPLTTHSVLFGILNVRMGLVSSVDIWCRASVSADHSPRAVRYLRCAYGAGVEHRYPLTTHSVLFGILECAYGAGVEHRYPLTTHCTVQYLSGW